jgi:DNA-binding NtrC family response regulator
MKKHKILVFSSDPAVISPLKASYDIDGAVARSVFLKKVGENPGILAVIDCDIKEIAGLSLYKEIKKLSPDSSVIMLSSTVTIPEAVEASKIGVADFIRKPALSERLLGSVKSALLRGEGPEIKPAPRLEAWLQGSGGKINGLFNDLESAVKGRKSILFISEPGIDILSLVKIMRDYSGGGQKLTTIDMLTFQKESLENIFWMVLQEAIASSDIIYFERFGAANEKHQASILDYIKSKALKGNIRLVASAQDLAEGKAFANWEKITVPNLRERKEDMPEIIKAYADNYSVKYGKKIESMALDVLKMICSYSWPGNYRELECVIENAVIANESGAITLKDIQLGSKMLSETLQSSRVEDLLDFKNSIEKNLVNIFYKKTGSEDMTSNLLDIPKSRISENLKK